MSTLLTAIVALISAAAATPTAVPRVRVQMTAATFESPTEVSVEVTLENYQTGCWPVLIDHTFSAFASESRPTTLLEFEVTNGKGDRIPLAHAYGATRRGFVPADLLILKCGATYGSLIGLGSREWEHKLDAGRYRLRARVGNRVFSFFDNKPEQQTRYINATGLLASEALSMLRDFSAVSDQVEFEVRQSQGAQSSK